LPSRYCHAWKGEEPELCIRRYDLFPEPERDRREGSVVIPMIPRLLRSVCSAEGGGGEELFICFVAADRIFIWDDGIRTAVIIFHYPATPREDAGGETQDVIKCASFEVHLFPLIFRRSRSRSGKMNGQEGSPRVAGSRVERTDRSSRGSYLLSGSD